jgi:hypothetical protein
MPSVTLQISEETWVILRELAEGAGKPVEEVLERAIEELANEQYAALRADPEAWAEYQKELALWDCTLMDGLDPNEIWHPDGTVTCKGAEEPTVSDDHR